MLPDITGWTPIHSSCSATLAQQLKIVEECAVGTSILMFTRNYVASHLGMVTLINVYRVVMLHITFRTMD